MEKNEVLAIQELVKKRYAECELNIQEFKGTIDTDKSYAENLKLIEPFLPKTKQMIEQEIQEAEMKAELERIRNIPTSAEQEKIYREMDGLINQAVVNPHTRGLIIHGCSSLGKTFRVKKKLDSLGKVEGKDYLIHSGHTTTLRLYIKLHNHSDKIHIFDDVNILENKTNLNLLKAMLNGNTHGVVEYDTSKKMPTGVMDRFIFTGKVIVLLNELPANSEHLKAVENRVLLYHLKLSRDEIVRLLYERAKREDIEGTTKQERLEIVDWIKDNTSKATLNLNYRLYEKAIHLFIQDRETWKDLVQTQVAKVDSYTELVISGMEVDKWCAETGGHKATYYRIKQRLGIPVRNYGK